MFFYHKDLPIEEIDSNSDRQVLAHGDGLMNVKVNFYRGLPEETTIPLHHHVHEQTTYVLNGSFKFEIDYSDHTEVKVVGVGDAIYFPKNLLHGCIPLEDNSQLLDSFTPVREDYLK